MRGLAWPSAEMVKAWSEPRVWVLGFLFGFALYHNASICSVLQANQSSASTTCSVPPHIVSPTCEIKSSAVVACNPAPLKAAQVAAVALYHSLGSARSHVQKRRLARLHWHACLQVEEGQMRATSCRGCTIRGDWNQRNWMALRTPAPSQFHSCGAHLTESQHFMWILLPVNRAPALQRMPASPHVGEASTGMKARTTQAQCACSDTFGGNSAMWQCGGE
jgi:hypothetical protein